jgi:hypothetical protein
MTQQKKKAAKHAFAYVLLDDLLHNSHVLVQVQIQSESQPLQRDERGRCVGGVLVVCWWCVGGVLCCGVVVCWFACLHQAS